MKKEILIEVVATIVVGLLLMPILIFAQKPRRDENYPPPDFLKQFIIIHDVCVEKTGVTEAAIKEFSDGEIHEDPALKCYMNCLFHEVNVVDDNGEVHYEKMKRLIPDDLNKFIQHIIDACESHVPKGATQCERAWSWHVCFKETDPVHYFLV
ncbi:pheromone-binding protein-related protein 6-like [Lucilia cuprina]|uniref:pheromone-binding protein-related protein 6-like n=1 Tax=Lucilia cuprina TaxID=7375 RepID=UPI001F0579B6|nr:pheromone-binding protein-related protein 6-like [Lucilia cuprina]